MRHAEVALNLGSLHGAGSLTYRVPDEMPIRPGDLVLVPLQTRLLPGVVVSVVGQQPAFPTKPVEDRVAEDAFVGPLQLTLARWIAAHYRAALYDCLALFLPPGLAAKLAAAARKGTWQNPAAPPIPTAPPELPAPLPGPPLTIQQQAAARQIVGAIEARQHKAFLLHGVTGSGKTHVYFEAVARALALERQAIVLVPEIALTPATFARFEERFPGRVAVIHSGLTDKQHRSNWERVRRGEADIVVGSRSALFAPVRRPGLVILDEEQEPSYHQDHSPRYHAREVALWWGQLARSPVVLGSATPDVESYFRAERGRYTLLTLASRFLPRSDFQVPPDRADEGARVPGAIEGSGRAEGGGDAGGGDAGARDASSRDAGARDAGSRDTDGRGASGGDAGGRDVGAINCAPTASYPVGAQFIAPSDGMGSPSDGTDAASDGTDAPSDGMVSPTTGMGSPADELIASTVGNGAPTVGMDSSLAGLVAPSDVLAPDHRNLPPVTIVDMRAELRAGNTSIFSRDLDVALGETLARGEQALLFLNRRGMATCVSCRDCGHVLDCRRCDIPVVYHRPDDLLVCHRCNRRRPMPDRCPGCGGTRIRFFGTGTQRVEQELAARFPDARVIRWDRDTTGKKGAYEALWKTFSDGEADVMVGTQMIAKALDFPRVTLVGVVLADVGLFLPDFRAGERAFQLLSQMAGRGGRGALPGRAIVQTYVPEHYAIQAAATHDYQQFYDREVAFRRTHGYPPHGRLVRLLYTSSKEERCVRETRRVRSLLDGEIARQGIADIQAIGPAPCFAERLRGRFRWAILLRGDRFARILDRLELSPGWVIDVDPVNLL